MNEYNRGVQLDEFQEPHLGQEQILCLPQRSVGCMKEAFQYRPTQLLYVVYFIVATRFDLFRSSSGNNYESLKSVVYNINKNMQDRRFASSVLHHLLCHRIDA